MPYTTDSLKEDKLGLIELKNIFNAIGAHKSALTKYTTVGAYNRKVERVKQIRQMKRGDLLLDEDAYKNITKLKDKRMYLMDEIVRIQKSKFMKGSKYINEPDVDYEQKFGNLHIKDSPINRDTGYIGNEPVEGSEKEVEKPKEAEKPKEEAKEELEIKPEKKKIKMDEAELADVLGAESEYSFKDLSEHFDELMEQLKDLPAGKDMKYQEIHKELAKTLKGMKALREDEDERKELLDKSLMYSKLVPASVSKAGAKTAKLEDIKKGIETLKEDKEMAKAMKPAMQYVEDVERLQSTPETSFESKEKNVFIDQSNKGKTVGDQNIGNIRAIGLAPMSAPAREEEVIPPPSERAKSLRRFANFRWVYSNQNSDLGYDSPFQRMQDQEDKRRFGMCYLPTSKLPKPETQEDLNKVKSFNTYPLVPSQSLSGIMQPAGELSFKSSTNPNARKIGIDEKQFANTKLYNFEPTQVNLKPNNPFSSFYGMEPLDQIKRNPNIQANTLEFSSVMYDDCPLEKIKNKYNKKIIT
jgi:hypothetical protein